MFYQVYVKQKNQTAHMKGRYIGKKNARLILNIADYCNIENKNGIVLLLGILHL